MLEVEGIIHGRRVDLNDATDLPDGARVRVVLQPLPPAGEEARRRFSTLFRACVDDPSFADAVEAAEAQRHALPPRDVDLDEAS